MYQVSSFIEGIQMLRIVTSGTCITHSDGDDIHKIIDGVLKKGDMVELDFSQVKAIAAPYLNAAIGQLFKSHNRETIKSKLTIVGLSPDNKRTVQLVMKNAYRYYNDIKYRRSLDSVMKRISENGVDNY